MGARRWLVDGMNVIGCQPDGWWRDRTGAMGRLAEDLEAFALALGEAVTVVFDGRPRDPVAGGRLEVVWAPGGPDAADDEIARRVGSDRRPGEVVVVTSDGGLAARVKAAGALVVGARAWRRRLLPAALEQGGGQDRPG